MAKNQSAIFFILLPIVLAFGCGDGVESSASSCPVRIAVAQSGSEVGIKKVSLGSGKVAQSIQVSSDTTLTTVQVGLLRVDDAAGTLTMVIESDSGNAPSGAAIVMADNNTNSATLDVSSISKTSSDFYTFTFSSSLTLEADTTYWITISASYSPSDTIYVQWNGTSAGTYTRGEAQTYNQAGGSWSSSNVSGIDLLTKIGCSS